MKRFIVLAIFLFISACAATEEREGWESAGETRDIQREEAIEDIMWTRPLMPGAPGSVPGQRGPF